MLICFFSSFLVLRMFAFSLYYHEHYLKQYFDKETYGTVNDLSMICGYRIVIQTIRQEWAEIMTKFENQHPHSIESAHAHLSFKILAM